MMMHKLYSSNVSLDSINILSESSQLLELCLTAVPNDTNNCLFDAFDFCLRTYINGKQEKCNNDYM